MQTYCRDLGVIVTSLEVAAVILTEDGLRKFTLAELLAEARQSSGEAFDDKDLLIVARHMGVYRCLLRDYGSPVVKQAPISGSVAVTP